jgi:hypothetical protein
VSRLGLTVTREQQKGACQALLAGVEELIDQIFFDSDVPRQHVSQKAIRERGLAVELPHHVRFLDGQDGARGHGCRRCHPLRLAHQAALAEEMASIEHCDHSLFSCVRHDRQPNNAYLQVQNARGPIALRKDQRPRFVLAAL